MTQFDAAHSPQGYQGYGNDHEPGSGLAITALVLGILSLLCLGLLAGIPAIIFGIVALVGSGKSPPTQGGKGMAIAGLSLGGLGTLSSIVVIPLLIGIMLPALGKARQSAQRLQSSSNVRALVQAVVVQSTTNNGNFMASADDWQQTLIDGQYADPAVFIAPYTDGLGDDYFFVPGGRDDFDATRVVIYEDPALNMDYTLIGFADGHVESVDQATALQILSNLTLPDGTRYAPHETDPSAAAAATGGTQP